MREYEREREEEYESDCGRVEGGERCRRKKVERAKWKEEDKNKPK